MPKHSKKKSSVRKKKKEVPVQNAEPALYKSKHHKFGGKINNDMGERKKEFPTSSEENKKWKEKYDSLRKLVESELKHQDTLFFPFTNSSKHRAKSATSFDQGGKERGSKDHETNENELSRKIVQLSVGLKERENLLISNYESKLRRMCEERDSWINKYEEIEKTLQSTKEKFVNENLETKKTSKENQAKAEYLKQELDRINKLLLNYENEDLSSVEKLRDAQRRISSLNDENSNLKVELQLVKSRIGESNERIQHINETESDTSCWKEKYDNKIKEYEDKESSYSKEVERLVGLSHNAQGKSRDLEIQNESLRSKLEVSSLYAKNLQKESSERESQYNDLVYDNISLKLKAQAYAKQIEDYKERERFAPHTYPQTCNIS